jgi:hypothetical protein
MAVGLGQEATEHLLGDVEVGDDSMPKRARRSNARGRPPDHPLRLVADCLNLAAHLVDRDYGRLEEDDPLPANVDDRVRGAEIDGHVASTVGGQMAGDAHRSAFQHEDTRTRGRSRRRR